MKSKPSKLFISQSLLCPFKVRTPGARHSNISLPFSFWSGRLFHTASSRGRRRQWHPTLVLLPGKSYGRRSLVGCSPWGREESDTTERLHFHFSLSCIGEETATHSSVLAWRIPGMGEPGGLPSMGSHRVGHD